MVTLHFQIDKRHLVFHTLTNCSAQRFVNQTPDQTVVAFQNAAWEKDKAAYQFLRYGISETSLIKGENFAELAVRADQFLDQMIDDSSFALVFEKTSQSLSMVQSEWESNRSQSEEHIFDITNLKVDGKFTVLLTHPAQKQGCFLREENKILWAYRNTWPNYNTVYIWHEMLHGFIPGGELEHAVIQLISDNELRIRLNKGKYPPLEGHHHLKKLMRLLLPEWRTYLRKRKLENNKETIREFIAQTASLPGVQEELSKISR